MYRLCEYSRLHTSYPPAIAPTIMKRSLPFATTSGKSASGSTSEKSSPQAKKRTKALRSFVTWSRIVPRSTG